MTDDITPTAPAPAAPPAPAEPTAPTAPATTGEQTAPEAPATPEIPDWAKDPTAAFAEVQKARQEAAAARTASRDAAKAEARNALLKELGLVKDDEPADPAKLAADLQATRTTATEAQRELALFRNAPAGTDVQALLDSRAFVKTVSEIDPTDSTALVAAIEKATKQNPRFKTTQVAATSGGDLTPGEQTLPHFTRAQLRDTEFFRANKDAILAAQADGRIH